MPTTTTKQDLISFLNDHLPPQLALDVGVDTLAALLIYQLVSEPEEVSVRLKGDREIVAMEFNVGINNKGRVIGKHGHIFKALRSICRSVAKGRGQDVILDLVEWDDNEWGDYSKE